MKVLVIEDSSVIRERMCDMLRRISCVELVGKPDNEEETVRSICTMTPDVVILGSSSVRDSLDMLRRIKMQPIPIKVIVMTNKIYSQYRKKCMDSGADYFLDKTRDIELLSSLLYCLADGTPHQEPGLREHEFE
jgi:DNA-binding NarL/FixJ family response regulator